MIEKEKRCEKKEGWGGNTTNIPASKYMKKGIRRERFGI
jgi:hypothetical protein